MRDLDFWRRLHAGSVTATELALVAAWPAARRGPFLGGVLRLAEHGEPELRAAALRVLAGCRGVAAVRAIVAALGDADARVREAALAALRITANAAPARYVHALFHPSAEIRRAAIAGELPRGAAAYAAYLRADPETAELATQLPWNELSLPLAFDLFERGRMTARELAVAVVERPASTTRAALEQLPARDPALVDSWIDRAVASGAPALAGHDAYDTLVAALAAITGEPLADRLIERLLEIQAQDVRTPRRLAIPLLAHGAFLALAAVLEPRLVGSPSFGAAHADAFSALAIRHAWPVRPPKSLVERLLALPIARDLPVAAALAGMLPAQRHATIATALGDTFVASSLIASNRGWAELCALPGETPAVEVGWLAQVEAADYKRYIALAGIAVTRFADKRLDAFLSGMPPRHRVPALAAALRCGLDASRDGVALARVCRAVAARVDRGGLAALLATALAQPDPKPLVLALIRACPAPLVADAAAWLAEAALIALLAVLDPHAPPLDAAPRDHELAIADALAARTHPAIRAWCAAVVTPPATLAPPPVASITAGSMVRRTLTEPERRIIATCALPGLERALAPALSEPATGVTSALSTRANAVHMPACAALIASGDPLADIAHELDRFGDMREPFLDSLDGEVAARWSRRRVLPVLAHACLYRWEAHTLAFAAWLEEAGGALATLGAIEALPGHLARRILWRGVAETMMFLRYRDRARFAAEATAELAAFCADRIGTEIGRHAARVLVALVEGGAIAMAQIRDRILVHLDDADGPTRGHLARIDRLDGVPAPVVRAPPASADLVAEIRACRDQAKLVAWCASEQAAVVEEAVLALLALGASGQRRLAGLLAEIDALPAPLPIVASVVLWDDDAAVDVARTTLHAGLRPAWRFHLGLGLAGRGDAGAADALAHAFAAACEDDPPWRISIDDCIALARFAGELPTAIALAESPHYHAYLYAWSVLREIEHPTPEALAALVRLLEIDDAKPSAVRFAIAKKLARSGDARGAPLIAWEIAEAANDKDWTIEPDAAGEILPAIVDAALIGGPDACGEKRMTAACTAARPHMAMGALDARVLDGAMTREARKAAAQHFVGDGGSDRIARVAEVFAWGVRRGVELTGKRFRIHSTAREQELGYTKLDESRIFVNVLPLLRDDVNGRDVVEGLVLHELGHHVYHRAPESLALWKQAKREGLVHLLNLIADEHLERNLRGRDPTYGDRLKRLGAFAFRHAPQEIAVATLLRVLRGRAAPALIAAELDVAFDEASVRVRRGALLAELDRQAHPLARFTRALRLGLGNREGDPRLAEALALVDGLRDFDMARMYEVTKQLAKMFGGANEIAEVFCSSESLEDGERERDVFGADLDDGELQREVERILDPRSRKSKPGDGPVRPWLNVNPREDFAKIATVVRVRGDADEHRKVAADVRRHASRLRSLLDDLGLRWLPQRARTQGRALDRTRLVPLVTRGDPRLLVARTPQRLTDLFLGVLVDCSDSMKAGNNLDRARRFAITVAEAVRDLPGVDARFFGFSDTKIFDAGTAADCDVVALRTAGGNNDAAALFHAANLALASPRRARVLVMISDGLPTECSVAALRGLVKQLSQRKKIVCAQVAVRPLAEVCFPHYVVLDGDFEPAVARFGRVVGDLVRRSLLS